MSQREIPGTALNESVPMPIGGDHARAAPDASPVPGMDMATFRNYLVRALKGDESVPPVVLNLVNGGHRGAPGSPEERERERWQAFLLEQAVLENLRAMDQYIDRLNRVADELRQRIDEQKTTIIENNNWIADMQRRHKGAASALDYYKENGVFEHDEEGTLKNKDAQKLLDEYCRRTGRKLESDTARAFAIKEQEAFERQEAERRKAENRHSEEEIKTDEGRLKEVEEKVRRAIERRNKIAEDNKSDPARAEQEIKKFWQEEGKKDLTLVDKIRGSEASNAEVRRETDDAQINLRQPPSPGDDDDLDLSTFKKPNDLARNFNAKVTEPAPAIPVAENAATYAQKRDAVPPGPQNS